MRPLTKLPTATWVSNSSKTYGNKAGRSFAAQNAAASWSRQNSNNYPLLERFVVHYLDHWPQDVIDDGGTTTRERSELSDLSTPLPFNTDIWVAYDLLIEPGTDSTAPFLVLGQFHSQPDSGSDLAVSPPWAITLDGTTLNLGIRTTPNLISNTNPPPTNYPLASPVQRGVWYRIVSRVNFDWNVAGTGLVQLWLNGVKMVDVTGPVGYNDALGPYFKFGVYRGQAIETIGAIYNNVQLSLSSLITRVTSVFSLPSTTLLNLS